MNIIVLIYMLLLSVCDVRDKKIPVLLLALGFFLALLKAIVFDVIIQGNNDMDVNIGTIIMASMPGIILLVIALITGKAGTADGIVLWILGILSDWKSTVLILSISLFIMGVYSAIMLLLHKVNKESEIPFIPFISMAYTIYAFRSIYVLPH